MFEQTEHLYDTEEIRKHAEGHIRTAQIVEGCVKGEAWKLLKGLIRLKRIEVLSRDDYDTLEDFRSDRAGLRFITDVMTEFESYAGDADAAVQMLEDLRASEGKVPLEAFEPMEER